MADPNKGEGAPPREVHVGPPHKQTNWLAWIALIAGILALLFALSRCNRQEPVVTDTNTSAAVEPVATTTPAPSASTAALAGTSGVAGYLAGTGALPHSFAFERLNFDTAASVVRPQDRDEVTAIAATLKKTPTARVRVVGYADARGSSEANIALGKARAESVKAAMVGEGIAADRIETASGGEADPVDSNATATGQAENRRTELVLLTR